MALSDKTLALISQAPEMRATLEDARLVLTMADRSKAWGMERDRCIARIEAVIAKTEST